MSEQPNPDQGAPAPEQPKPQPPQAAASPASDQREAGEEGAGGKAAILKELAAERDARQALQQQMKDQTEALRKALGGEKPAEGEDIVKSLQQQMAQMQRDNLVNTVARRHGLTDEGDVAFLRSAPDEAAMSALAERLKAPAAPPQPPSPQPDAGQGERPPAQTQEDLEYAAFFPDER